MKTQIDSKTRDWYFSEEAERVIELGRRHELSFKIVGRGPLPLERVDIDGWWYELLRSLANIPSEGLERLVLLKNAGVEVKGYIIAHETQKPANTQPQPHPSPRSEPQQVKTSTHDHFDPIPAVKTILGVLGVVVTVLGFLLVAAIRLDPMLIVVLKDDTWVSVYDWLE